MTLGCVLLAAGSGRRFGGDKLLFRVDGMPMIERALRLHAAIRYSARVIVVRPGDAEVQAFAAQFGFPVAENARHADGIGTSVCAGVNALIAMDAAIDGVLCAVCDQPYLTRDTLLRLIDRFAETPERIVAPACNGRRGNPAIFPRQLLPELTALCGDKGGSAVIARRPELLTTIPVDDARELGDIDYRIEAKP